MCAFLKWAEAVGLILVLQVAPPTRHPAGAGGAWVRQAPHCGAQCKCQTAAATRPQHTPNAASQVIQGTRDPQKSDQRRPPTAGPSMTACRPLYDCMLQFVVTKLERIAAKYYHAPKGLQDDRRYLHARSPAARNNASPGLTHDDAAWSYGPTPKRCTSARRGVRSTSATASRTPSRSGSTTSAK